MQKYTPWTTEELETLKILRLEQELPYKEIAKTLGRDITSCHNAAIKYFKSELQEKRQERKRQNEKILKLWESGCQKNGISERFNRSVGSISDFLRYTSGTCCLEKKGLVRNKSKKWTEEENRIIIQNQPIKLKEIAKKLKRTEQGVFQQIRNLRKKGFDIKIKKRTINREFVEYCFVKNGG